MFIAAVSSVVATVPVPSSSMSPYLLSGIVGAAAAVIVMLLNNIFLYFREENKIDNDLDRDQKKYKIDAEQKSLDRTMTLRREVYLPLAAAMQDAQAFLGRLAVTRVEETNPLTVFSAAAAKLAVVAEMSTAILASEISADISIAFMNLTLAAAPAREATEDLAMFKEFRAGAEKNGQLAQLEIDKFLRSGEKDDNKFGALCRNREAYAKLEQNYRSGEVAASKDHAINSVKYTRKLIEILPNLGMRCSELLLAVRQDLGLVHDASKFLSSQARDRDRMIQALKDLLDITEKSLHEDSA